MQIEHGNDSEITFIYIPVVLIIAEEVRRQMQK